MTSAVTQFINCSILRGSKIIREDLWVRDGKIINPEPFFFVEQSIASVKVDCKGAIICPGFIDVQINGGFGVDFSYNVDNDNDVEDGIKKVATGIMAHGVTAFCPTVVTSPVEIYHKILPRINKRPGGKNIGAEILGIHLEGPFISKEKRGAHPTECLKTLDHGIQDMLDVYGTLDDVCMLTMAPEQPRSAEVISELVKKGITVSLGHSMGTLSDGEAAVNAGASFITHLFNAMLPFHHRDPGLVGLLSSDAIPENTTVHFGIISDGIHTHPAALRIAFRTHPKGLVLVTDAISPMGLGTGTHHIGQQVVEIKGKKAFISGTNTLCGSIATMDQCVRHFVKAAGCSIVEALDCATLHPAKALGIYPKKGSLEFGADADFIFLDQELHVLATFIAGECVWERQNDSPFNVILKTELGV